MPHVLTCSLYAETVANRHNGVKITPFTHVYSKPQKWLWLHPAVVCQIFYMLHAIRKKKIYSCFKTLASQMILCIKCRLKVTGSERKAEEMYSVSFIKQQAVIHIPFKMFTNDLVVLWCGLVRIHKGFKSIRMNLDVDRLWTQPPFQTI